MKAIHVIVVAVAVCACGVGAQADVVMDWVTVGNPGNLGELSGEGAGGEGPDVIVGRVDYVYNVGKYEVTNSQYAELLNGVATVGDPYGLYNTDMGGGWNDIGGISRSGSGTGGDPWVYTARANRENRAVNYVSWYDTLRFANWMHNGQGSGDTEDGAYDMSLGSSVVRKPGALVFLPSEDEWYKAAYHKNDGVTGNYFDYPTSSDSLPGRDMTESTNPGNNANYYGSPFPIDPPYYTTVAGEFELSDSPYGTFDQGGNIYEWNEADIDGDGSSRGLRGGSFIFASYTLHAADRHYNPSPTFEYFAIGFRVAEVPEPATIALLAFGGLLLTRRRR